MSHNNILRTLAFAAVLVAAVSCAETQTAPPAAAKPEAAPKEAQPVFSVTEHLKGITVAELANGMLVGIKENHIAPVVELRVYVKTGSMTEGEFLGTGISHYLEHLVHTARTVMHSEKEQEQIIQSIGGKTNAYTTGDHTCYHITTSKLYIDTAVEVFSDWIMNCQLPQEHVDREKGVILQEIKMGEDEASRVMWHLFASTLYTKHQKRIPTIGYEENFVRITRDDLVKYYSERYVPNNMLVVVAGDVDSKAVLEKINSEFGRMERRPLVMPEITQEPKQIAPRHAEGEMDIQISPFYMAWHTVDILSRDMYPLDLMSYILSNGSSTRLVKKLREEMRLVNSISTSSTTPYYGGGIFGVYCDIDAADMEAVKDEIVAEIERMKTEPVTDEELATAKKQMLSDNVFYMQEVESQASVLAGNLMELKDPLFNERYTVESQKVTKEDIMRVAREYFTPENLTTCILRPKAEKGGAAGVQPVAMTAPASKVERFKLPNGLTVLLKRNPEVPLVNVQAVFKGGIRFENEKNNGVTKLMNTLFFKGTANRTADEIARTIDSLPCRTDSYCGNNSFGISIELLKGDLGSGLDLFSDMLKRPLFDEKELEMERASLLDQLKQQEDDWQAEIVTMFRQNFFKKHPYRLNGSGTPGTVSAITRDDIKAFYNAFCVSNNMVIAMYGDFDPAAARAAIEKYFSDMPSNPAFVEPNIPKEPAMERSFDMRKPTQKKQAAIIVAFPGTTMHEDDKYAMTIIDVITSGLQFGSGRIYDALRLRNDLAYFVHATNWSGLDPGSFYVMTQTEPDKVEKAIGLINLEMDRMMEELVSDEEMDAAKQTCVVSDQMGRQTNADMAMEAALSELYGYGYDYNDGYPDKIKAVTKEDVKRVANKYFSKRAVFVTMPEKTAAPVDGKK